ncbi:MAG: peptidase S8 [Planctomycetes bacterium]|nr:peptidase S8 [Planctomycetota bacterium]
MKSLRLAPLALSLLLVACGGADPRTPVQPDPADEIPANVDELVIDLVDGRPLSELTEVYPLLKQAHWNSDESADEGIAVATVAREAMGELLAKLRQDPDVEAAEPNLRYSIEPGALNQDVAAADIPDDEEHPALDGFPNDALYGRQWNMSMVHAREAWRFAKGEDVIVAVIDTGVAYEDAKGLWAPDLKRTRFVPGKDFIDDDDIAADDNGHGTHCAGTIAQSTNNEIGVVGLAPECKIMPLKVLTAEGWGTTSDIADAIRFAADNGAHVLSLSLGGGGYSRVLASAVQHARDKGCLVVCAAGNGGRGRVEYPAAYPGATAVSSVGPTGQLAFYSSYGKQCFIAGPGGDKSKSATDGVLQNTLDFNRPGKTHYAYYQGTSMATPHVAAAAALLYSAGVTDPAAVEALLAKTTLTPPGVTQGSWTPQYGHGILDAGAAVRAAISTPGWWTLGLTGLLVGLTVLLSDRKHLKLPLLAAGAVAGGCGLFFLESWGVGELPLVGPFLVHGMADWDLVLFGARWHWTPLFASALIPAFLAYTFHAKPCTRALTAGIALGWTARLVAGILVPFSDVRFVPGHGVLDSVWLGANAVLLLGVIAACLRLGRGKDAHRVTL